VKIQVDSLSEPTSGAGARKRGRRLAPQLAGRDPLAWVAVALVAIEAALASVDAAVPALSLVVLLLAPGLALSGLLPEGARRSWSATLAAAAPLGLAVSSIAIISASSAGVPVNGTVVRVLLAAIAVAGLLLPRTGRRDALNRTEALGLVGLVAAVGLGVILRQRIIGGSPVPGNDWAKYALYADEIRAQGSLLIDNPFWMLGVPFREDPGVPALYGAYLTLSDQPASVVMHGIAVVAVVQVTSVFALVRTLWGPAAAVTAAALWAVLPLNGTLLGWHGLANAAALALLPMVLLYAATVLRRELDVRAGVGAALVLVALAAAHRLSLAVGLTALGATAVAAGVMGGWRRVPGRGLAAVAAATVVISPGVLYDLIERNRTFGGTLGYRAYLPSKLDVGLLLRDLTIPFSVVAGIAVLSGLWRLRRDPRLVPLLALLTVVALLACSWVVHFPLYYTRMAYYLPLALVPLVAVAIWRIPRPRWLPVAAAATLVAYLGVVSFAQGDNVQRFYGFTNSASLKGLDAVASSLRPGEVVVTDRCWSFLSTWLLHTRTLPALDSSDIQPKAELPHAREARAIIAGTARGRALARRLGVRFLVVDPTCSDTRGNASQPPRLGRPFFVSGRLVVLELPARGPGAATRVDRAR
jgi:hypothetical protein